MALLKKKDTPTEESTVKRSKRKEKEAIEKLADAKNVKEIERQYIEFDMLLTKVQQYMSTKYAVDLYDAEKRSAMKKLIEQYMKDNNYYVPNLTLGEVSERLYIEMAEYSFLTSWLKRVDVEEININSWEDVQIIPARGAPFKLDEQFTSAQHAMDVIKRLLHNNKNTFDQSRPIVIGFLGTNIRITSIHELIVGSQCGVAASIRIVNPAKITREQFIDNGTCTEEMYEFISESFNHGISEVFAGETGCGKTTFMADVMSQFPDHKRLITIEKSVREFDLVKRNENGKPINNVVHLVTHETDDQQKNVTMQKLLTTCLTMHPHAICVAEMKNEEAWEAQEAARTGHTVLTTTHASSIEGIYSRLATLCLQKYSEVPYEIIISLVVEAFPIGIFMKQLDDGSRRIMEIAECEYKGKSSSKLYDTRTLYRYEITAERRTENGVEIDGHFVKVNAPSESLMKRLRENGLSREMLDKFARV